MRHYQPKTFNLSTLEGLSERQISEHLKLYEGYVKHTNLIFDLINTWETDKEKNLYQINELRRRLGFEFDGMRSHEYYFGALEGGSSQPNIEMSLIKQLSNQFSDFNTWLEYFKGLSTTRGSGWAILYYDNINNQFINAWIDEHHLGHLSSLPIILAVDLWEHAYLLDYNLSDRKKYVDSYFKNVNWPVVNGWFETILQSNNR